MNISATRRKTRRSKSRSKFQAPGLPPDVLMSARTAKARKQPSKPVKILYEKGLIKGRVLDYGCGRGADVAWLKSLGYEVVGYDPYWANNPSVLKHGYYDTILVTYVLNTVFPETRHEILENVKLLLKPGGKVYITVRSNREKIPGRPYLDGVITASNTFQKTFSPEEILDLVRQHFHRAYIISKHPLIVGAER